MEATSPLKSGTSRESVVSKLSAGVSGLFSRSSSRRQDAQAGKPAKFSSTSDLSSKVKERKIVEDDDEDDDEFEDPRLRVRQLLGASSGRVVKSVMAQPSAIKKHIKAHADLIAEKERNRMEELRLARAERAKEMELERQKRHEKWLQRQGQVTKQEDDTEARLRIAQEEERRNAMKTKTLQDFDAPWHTNTLAGISQVLGELEAENALPSHPLDQPRPPVAIEETAAKLEAGEDSSRLTAATSASHGSIPRPEYMDRADEVLSSAAGKSPLTPWSMAALPDHEINDDAKAAPYGSRKQKVEENESWADMLERTKRSLHRDRDKSREKTRRAVGLTSPLLDNEQIESREDEGPMTVRQDRAASSSEEHRRLPKSEREWSFVPRQKVRNDVLLLAQRTARKQANRGKKK